MTADPRVFLAAALDGMTGAARDLDLRSVEVRRLVPAHLPRPSRPAPIMPPPATSPTMAAVPVQPAADPTPEVAAQVATMRAIWARMSPEARRIFLGSLA